MEPAQDIGGNKSGDNAISAPTSSRLTSRRLWVNCPFDMSTTSTTPLAPIMIADETERDFAYPQHEAAFFYGLFLRGHSAEVC